MITHKDFHILATPEQVSLLTRSVAEFLQKWIQDPVVIHDLRLVLSEACTNVLLHAYGPQNIGELEVHIQIEPGQKVRLEIRDNGVPFEGPTHTTCSGPEDEHGRGLYIISQLMDSFAYKHAQGRNTLRLERGIEEHAWKE